MFRRDEKGQVVVEYALVFPVQLLITLAVIQLAHIFVATHLVSYAAFCGARAVLVGEDAHDAATVALSAVAGPTGATAQNLEFPGWGEMRRSGAAREKTQTEVTTEEAGGTTLVRCDVEHWYELTVPLGNYLAYGLGHAFMGMNIFDDSFGAPHIAVKGTSTLAKPW